jgi:cell division protein FtsN
MTKGRIYLCLIIIVIMAGIGFLYNDGYFYTGEPPVLEPDTLITRIKPEDPGGMILDDYNSIYDQIKSQNHNIKSVTLMPEPELPLPPQDISETDPIDSIVSRLMDANTVSLETKENTENIDTSKSLKIITSPDNNVKPQVKRPKSAYYVQVASARTTVQAKKEFARITKSHGKLLANIEHKIDKYNIANKGVYYRLLLGPLKGSAHAKLICKKLATAKQTCIIKKI